MRTRPWTPWLYVAPALLVLGFYLVYPAMVTIALSFYERVPIQWSLGDLLRAPSCSALKAENSPQRGPCFAGLANYERIFTERSTQIALRNNVLWLIVVTSVTVGLGLMLAVLLDRVRYESLAKSTIFMPMAISFVGAGIIWKFMYAYRPPIYPQIGLLNALRVALGEAPIAWLTQAPWVNNLALMAVFIWIWTGYCLVILSAAYKGIDRDLLEAARIDGANEWQVFRHVVLPTLRSTIVVVATTMTVFTLKVFDIVYVMTNGNYETEVLANAMYKQMYSFWNFGLASAIAVVLFVAVLPFIVINIRRFLEQEAVR